MSVRPAIVGHASGMESAESEAHREIRNLVAAYNAFGDRGRFDELMGLFEPDAVMEIGDGHTYEGADRIREIFTRTRDSVTSGAQPSYVQHHTSPVHITMVDQDHATGRAYFSVLMEHGLDHWGRYDDEYRRTDGNWRFARRRVRTDGFTPDGWAAQRLGDRS